MVLIHSVPDCRTLNLVGRVPIWPWNRLARFLMELTRYGVSSHPMSPTSPTSYADCLQDREDIALICNGDAAPATALLHAGAIFVKDSRTHPGHASVFVYPILQMLM